MNSIEKKCEYVLQAIEHLRHRKARPDLEGIKNYAFRRYGIDPDTCTADVEELIECEQILKVEFKGRTSYRNAAKYFGQENNTTTTEMSPATSREPSPEPLNYSSAVTAAIAAILCDQPTPPSQTGAVSLRSIASYLQSRDHGRYSRKYIDNLIERETQSNNIISISKETFTLPTDVLRHLDRRWKHDRAKNKIAADGSDRKQSHMQNKMGQQVMGQQVSSQQMGQRKRVEKSPPPTPPRPERVGQRMKRAKKVFDPSDLEVPRKRGRPVGTCKKNRDSRSSLTATPERSKSPCQSTSSPPPVSYSQSEFKSCLLCKYYTVILRGVTSKMLVCSECNRNVHAKCLGFDQDILPRVPESEWKCPDCRPCSVCKLVQDQDTILLCCQCDTTVHRACLNSVPTVIPDGHWICDGCRERPRETSVTPACAVASEVTPAKEMSIVEDKSHVSPTNANIVTRPTFPLLPNLGPWVFGTRQLELKGPPLEWDVTPVPDPSIPDASLWTPEDVENYFNLKGFRDQASLLRQHEIDGPSLLLMKRNDVVRNMGLKLGPAVKMYTHIRRLQTRRADLLFA